MKIITRTLNHVCIIPPSLHRNKSTANTADVKKERRGAEVQLHSFLTSVLDRSEWPTSRPGRFTAWKKPRYPLNGRLSGSQSGSGWLWRRKDLLPLLHFEPRTVQPVVSRYTDSAIAAPNPS
jgi:hypothetical protein